MVTVESGDAFGGSASAGFRINPRLAPTTTGCSRSSRTPVDVPRRIVHGFAVEARALPWPPRRASSAATTASSFSVRRWPPGGRPSPCSSRCSRLTCTRWWQATRSIPRCKTLLGLARVIPQEQHTVRCACVDVDARDAAAWVGGGRPAGWSSLIEELRADDPGVVAAHRGGQRFVLGFEPLRLETRRRRPARLREGGVYLVTGGLGGVTFVLCAYLAHSVKARLVLTGRSVLPPRDAVAGLASAAHGELDPMSVRIDRVRAPREARGRGARAQARTAETSRRWRRRWPRPRPASARLHGVIHGAGIVGGNTFRPLRRAGSRGMRGAVPSQGAWASRSWSGSSPAAASTSAC